MRTLCVVVSGLGSIMAGLPRSRDKCLVLSWMAASHHDHQPPHNFRAEDARLSGGRGDCIQRQHHLAQLVAACLDMTSRLQRAPWVGARAVCGALRTTPIACAEPLTEGYAVCTWSWHPQRPFMTLMTRDRRPWLQEERRRSPC